MNSIQRIYNGYQDWGKCENCHRTIWKRSATEDCPEEDNLGGECEYCDAMFCDNCLEELEEHREKCEQEHYGMTYGG